MKKKRITLISVIIIWMIVVFSFSSQISQKSSSTSRGVIKAILNVVSNIHPISEEQIGEITEALQPVIRKLAHFTVYAIGGILFFELYNTCSITTKQKILYAVLSAMLYAATDEFHQLFVPRKKRRVKRCLNRYSRSFYWNSMLLVNF